MINNQWYAVASSNEVKENSLLGVKRFSSDIVLFRVNGDIHCIEDKCSHRGAALSKGVIKNEHVQCPFHGLEFSENGECKFIPANGKNFQGSLDRYNVKHYHTREQDDIIFVWYGDTEPSYDPPFFSSIRDKKLKMAETTDIWNIHYSRVIENQLDTVHLPFVHHNTIGRGNKTLVNGPKTIWVDDYTLQTSANNEVDCGQKPLKPDESIIKPTYLMFKYPNLWLNHVSDKILVMIFFAPIDDYSTKLYLRFYNKITRFGTINSIISWFGKQANYIVQGQDKRVVITQKPNISGLSIGENLVRGDKPIIEYRKRRNEMQNM